MKRFNTKSCIWGIIIIALNIVPLAHALDLETSELSFSLGEGFESSYSEGGSSLALGFGTTYTLFFDNDFSLNASLDLGLDGQDQVLAALLGLGVEKEFGLVDNEVSTVSLYTNGDVTFEILPTDSLGIFEVVLTAGIDNETPLNEQLTLNATAELSVSLNNFPTEVAGEETTEEPEEEPEEPTDPDEPSDPEEPTEPEEPEEPEELLGSQQEGEEETEEDVQTVRMFAVSPALYVSLGLNMGWLEPYLETTLALDAVDLGIGATAFFGEANELAASFHYLGDAYDVGLDTLFSVTEQDELELGVHYLGDALQFGLAMSYTFEFEH
jgi:hypothetical protein